jgi:hypothetical protein
LENDFKDFRIIVACAAARHPLQVLVVVILQQLPDRLHQLFKAVERSISLRGIDAPVDQSYCIFNKRVTCE